MSCVGVDLYLYSSTNKAILHYINNLDFIHMKLLEHQRLYSRKDLISIKRK